MCEPPCVKLFLWAFSMVQLFDFLTFDISLIFDSILIFAIFFDISLKPLQPITELFLKQFHIDFALDFDSNGKFHLNI